MRVLVVVLGMVKNRSDGQDLINHWLCNACVAKSHTNIPRSELSALVRCVAQSDWPVCRRAFIRVVPARKGSFPRLDLHLFVLRTNILEVPD